MKKPIPFRIGRPTWAANNCKVVTTLPTEDEVRAALEPVLQKLIARDVQPIWRKHYKHRPRGGELYAELTALGNKLSVDFRFKLPEE